MPKSLPVTLTTGDKAIAVVVSDSPQAVAVREVSEKGVAVRFALASEEPKALQVSGLLDSDTAAWRDAIIANGGTIGASALTAFDAFIRGLKTDSVWDLVLDMGAFVGVDNLNSALIKIKTGSGSRTITNTNFVSGDYTASGSTAGLAGNGSTKHLAIGSLASISSTNLSLGFYGDLIQTSGSFPMFISQSAGSVDATLHAGANLVANISTNTITASATGQTSGMIIGSRTTASLLTLYRNGSSIASNVNASTTWTSTFSPFVFARNSNGSPALYSSARGRMYFIAAGMDATQALNISSRINTLMTAFGANVY